MGIAEKISELEQRLIQMKSRADSRADCVLWHSLYLNLGQPSTDYNTPFLHNIRVEPKCGRFDNLLVFPVLSQGMVEQEYSYPDASWKQGQRVGRLNYVFVEPCQLFVLNTTSFSRNSPYAGPIYATKDLELTIYSNYELFIKVNEKTSI